MIQENLGYPYTPKDIQVNTSEEAYLYGVEVLNGKRGAGFDMVALNAGAALYISNITSTMAEGIELAIKTIHSGKALLLLNKFAKIHAAQLAMLDQVIKTKRDR